MASISPRPFISREVRNWTSNTVHTVTFRTKPTWRMWRQPDRWLLNVMADGKMYGWKAFVTDGAMGRHITQIPTSRKFAFALYLAWRRDNGFHIP